MTRCGATPAAATGVNELFRCGEQACGVYMEVFCVDWFSGVVFMTSSLVGVPGGEMSCRLPFTTSGV